MPKQSKSAPDRTTRPIVKPPKRSKRLIIHLGKNPKKVHMGKNPKKVQFSPDTNTVDKKAIGKKKRNREKEGNSFYIHAIHFGQNKNTQLYLIRSLNNNRTKHNSRPPC